MQWSKVHWYNIVALLFCFIISFVLSDYMQKNYVGEWKSAVLITAYAAPFLVFILLDMYKEIR
jgi:hypothetical protein